MGTMTATRGSGVEAAPRDGTWQARRPGRCTMFKTAHLVSEGAVLDCVLLDLSPHGAQIFLLTPADLPDVVILWLPGGESRSVRRRWQRGLHIGFEAVADAASSS